MYVPMKIDRDVGLLTCFGSLAILGILSKRVVDSAMHGAHATHSVVDVAHVVLVIEA